jgi:flagellar hook protein FlgE
MSLLTSLSTGTTGLASASAELSVVGDNLANANTVGFKSERAAFADALAQTVVGGQGQIGLGSRLQAVQRILSEGSLSNTGVATDLALQGTGYFEVSGTTSDGRQGSFLTRAGQFTVDNSGFLVNLDGLRVQGYPADPAGNITSALGDLQVGNASSAPLPTTAVTIQGNLQSDATPPTLPFDATQPGNTSNFSTSVTVYDSLGADHQVQVYFSKTAPNAWTWNAMTAGALIGSGSLTFDPLGTGQLQPPTTGPATLPASGGAAAQPFTIDFTGISQFAGSSATTFVGQNGFSSGQLSAIQIDKTGTVQGIFTNGQTRPIGQVGVARVAAPDQLERTGGNLYAVTRGSGQAVMGAAGTGGRAFISSGTLEQSNVDIADQFVRMITAQRNFQANSKTITTADQLLSELIAMKR